MRDRVKKNWPFAILAFFILTIASPPFLEVYQLGNSPLFIGMLAVICLITLLFKDFLITFPLYLISYIILLYNYFPLGLPFSLEWFTALVDEVTLSYNQILSGELSYMPQTIALVIILFFLIALAVLMIHYERPWLSYLLIVGYQLLLVAFNQLELSGSLLLITCTALLFHQLKKLPDTISRSRRSQSFVLSMMVFALLAGAAYSFQQLFPQARSFLFIQTDSIRDYFNQLGLYQHIAQYGQSGLSKSGFSEDDQQLGGPLLDDAAVVFTAYQQDPHYWRIETKDTYTGKGWENSNSSLHFIGNQDTLILEDVGYSGPLGPEAVIRLAFTDAVSYLPQPYGRVQLPLNGIGGAEEISEKNRINLKEAPKEFQLYWQELAYEEDDLQNVLLSDYSFYSDDWQIAAESGVTSQYFELPTSVSDRTITLANELTHNETSLYGKVKAVEQYLKTNEEFRYSKTDTTYPASDQDYVEHFLFDSKVGYCDNFSTAMVVLLRAQGIPSRWAKGFAPGEVTGEQDGLLEYTIRNSHAHSWPEVYFEGYGWIPFEPTPSFDNPDTPAEPAVESVDSSETLESSTIASSNEVNDSSSSANTSESSSVEKTESSSTEWRSLLKWSSSFLGILLAVIGALFLRKNYFLLRYRLYRRIKPNDFNNTYLLILRQAEKQYTRAANEPLARYAQHFEDDNPRFDGSFIALTKIYEESLYGKQQMDRRKWRPLLDQTAEILAVRPKKN